MISQQWYLKIRPQYFDVKFCVFSSAHLSIHYHMIYSYDSPRVLQHWFQGCFFSSVMKTLELKILIKCHHYTKSEIQPMGVKVGETRFGSHPKIFHRKILGKGGKQVSESGDLLSAPTHQHRLGLSFWIVYYSYEKKCC